MSLCVYALLCGHMRTTVGVCVQLCVTVCLRVSASICACTDGNVHACARTSMCCFFFAGAQQCPIIEDQAKNFLRINYVPKPIS